MRICTFNKFPSDTDVAGQGPRFRTTVLQENQTKPNQTNKFMPMPSDFQKTQKVQINAKEIFFLFE